MTSSTGQAPVLGALSAEQFLADYWQRRPLFVASALAAAECEAFLSADEIAGLALEDFIESRIIYEYAERPEAERWQVAHGPFAEQLLRELPPVGWTLHVQGLEQHFAALYQLLDRFTFIPNWRLDDIMVSLAPDGGSAGPHFDQYDVFLLQASGRKRWLLGQHCGANEALLPNTELAILQDFRVEQEIIAEPGDLLYIPPGVAHYGIALGESMTYSIGFRAPSHTEILSDFAHYLIEQKLAAAAGAPKRRQEARYQDPDLALQPFAGEISATALARIQRILEAELQDSAGLQAWFGQFITSPKHGFEALIPKRPMSTAKFRQALAQRGYLCWHEGARFAYHVREQDAGENDVRGKDAGETSQQEVLIFIDGEAQSLALKLLSLVQCLFSQRRIALPALQRHSQSEAAQTLLYALYCQGQLYFEAD